MVRGYQTFKEFHEAGEGIARTILADRLRKLETAGIIVSERGRDGWATRELPAYGERD